MKIGPFEFSFQMLRRLPGAPPFLPPIPPQGGNHSPFMTNPFAPVDPMRLLHIQVLYHDGSQWDIHHHHGGCRFIGSSYLFFDREGSLVLDIPNTGGVKHVWIMNSKDDPQKQYFGPPVPRRPRAKA